MIAALPNAHQGLVFSVGEDARSETGAEYKWCLYTFEYEGLRDLRDLFQPMLHDRWKLIPNPDGPSRFP